MSLHAAKIYNFSLEELNAFANQIKEQLGHHYPIDDSCAVVVYEKNMLGKYWDKHFKGEDGEMGIGVLTAKRETP